MKVWRWYGNDSLISEDKTNTVGGWRMTGKTCKGWIDSANKRQRSKQHLKLSTFSQTYIQ